ncbi:FG-GAP repeat domain-containing protein, partial [Macromonas bipunctata]|uniref:FG-GAP repeat domain-containing protein n=1 Tax=Macromonas bipunctata TaxID=183670 RepID=UPI001F0CA4DF
MSITPSDGSTRVTEGSATDTYTVKLLTQPTQDVTVTLDDTNGQVTLNTTTLTFTSTNWDQPQTVTVTALNDTVNEGKHTGIVKHTVSSTDPDYTGLPVHTLVVNVIDNDAATYRPFFVAHSETAPFGLADVGGAVKPVLVDIDGDGDLDAFVGNGEGNTLFLKNNGTASSAAFAVASTNPFGLVDVGSVAKPALVDIDGDGDLDAFVGNWDGDTRFFRNTGNASSAAFAAVSTNPFGLVNVGYGADSAFADIDGDGDLDALVGNSAGDIRLFANTGNASSAAFAAASTNPFGLANVGGRASLTVADVDADGDLDILVGNSNGDMLLFANTGAATTLPAFAAAITNPLGLAHVDSNASPALADIDADGDLDVLVGNSAGAIQFFEGVAPKLIITPSGDGTRVSEGGATGDTYTVKLLTKPTHDVTVTLDDTSGQITFDQATLTFTTSNWNQAQTVTVTARNDTVNEGVHAGVVQHSVSSDDPDYNNLQGIDPLVVNITDNDVATYRPFFVLSANSEPLGLTDVGNASA